VTNNPPVSSRSLRFGTRGSALALAQARLVVNRFSLAYPDLETETTVIRTEGDIDKTSPLTEIGGRGVFTNDLEAAVLSGRVDAAIHSAKDLPSTLHSDVPIVAIPVRDDPRDVLISRHRTTLDRLPVNPVIGTSSRRRAVQVRRLRPDARVVNVRGNVDTRIRKAEGPEFDAIVLAAAGVRRMGWGDRIDENFAIEQVVPSPGQGAIAVQAREHSHVAFLLAAIDDWSVAIPVGIERAFLRAIGGGCSMPVGAYVSLGQAGYRLVAMLADESGDRFATTDESLSPGDERRHAAEIANRLKAEVGFHVAPSVWNGWRERSGDLTGVRVVVTRPLRQAAALISALTERGATPLALPAIRIEPVADSSALDAALGEAQQGAFSWMVFTSVNAVEVVADRLAALGIDVPELARLEIAAVGGATARAASERGFHVNLVASSPNAESLADGLRRRIEPCDRLLYPRSALGRDVIPEELRRAGAEVVTINAYDTVPETEIDPEVVGQVRRGEADIMTFTSPSSVRNVLDLLGEDRSVLNRMLVICAGPVTAAAARDAGLRVDAVCDDPGASAMVQAIATHWLAEKREDHLPSHAVSRDFIGRSAE
jgi:hydroxymethylbilane synthase